MDHLDWQFIWLCTLENLGHIHGGPSSGPRESRSKVGHSSSVSVISRGPRRGQVLARQGEEDYAAHPGLDKSEPDDGTYSRSKFIFDKKRDV
jgi:hypothetical protein